MGSINFHLAAAIRRVNSAYYRLPEDRRPDVTGERWTALEREIDEAAEFGDRDRALKAIADWQGHALKIIGHCGVSEVWPI